MAQFHHIEEFNPWQNLAAAIVFRAVLDAKRINRDGITHRTTERPYSRAELEEFFNSQWCSMLLGGGSLTGEDIRRKVGW